MEINFINRSAYMYSLLLLISESLVLPKVTVNLFSPQPF